MRSFDIRPPQKINKKETQQIVAKVPFQFSSKSLPFKKVQFLKIKLHSVLLLTFVVITFFSFSFARGAVNFNNEFSSYSDRLGSFDEFFTHKTLSSLFSELPVLRDSINHLSSILLQSGQVRLVKDPSLLLFERPTDSIGLLATSGYYLSRAGQDMFNVVDALNSFSNTSNSSPDSLGAINAVLASTKNNIPKVLNLLTNAQRDLNFADQALDKINDKKLASLSPELIKVKKELPRILQSITEKRKFLSIFPTLLGISGQRRYLLLLQNDAELRATGGFVGMYGIISLDPLGLKPIQLTSSYFLEEQRLKKITDETKKFKSYHFQDCNFSLDFTVTAQLCTMLYNIVYPEKIDGVIAITPNLITNLLSLTGSIEFPEYKLTINAGNFRAYMDLKGIYYKRNYKARYPKDMIKDFMPRFIDKVMMLEPSKKENAMDILYNNIRSKNFLISLSDQNEQQAINSLNVSGAINKTDGDYLALYNVNSGGRKSSIQIKESIIYKVDIISSGQLNSVVTLNRKHTGTGKFPDSINYNSSRLLIPLNSKVVNFTGFTKDRKANESPDLNINFYRLYTLVSGWTTVKPGDEKSFSVTYELPFKLNLSKSKSIYSLLIQKQPGSIPADLRIQINAPEGFVFDNGSNKFELTDILNKDISLKLTLQHK